MKATRLRLQLSIDTLEPGPSLAIGQGLAEWALERPAAPARPRRSSLYWLLRFPLELVLAFLEIIAAGAGRLLFALFRIDDRGHVHVRARGQAIGLGILLGLLFLAFDLVIVAAYNAGLSEGLSRAWRAGR